MKYSRRIENLAASESIAVSALTARLRSEGRDIIGLHLGEPDIPPPKNVLRAAGEALERGQVRYGSVPGLPALRKKIVERFNRSKGTSLGSENAIVGNGSKHVLYTVFQSLCREGDEVLIPRPYWISFPESVKLAGAVPVFVDHANLRIDFDDLEKNIGPRTKLLLLNTPNNPSGIVYGEEDIVRVAKLAREHDFLIVCDEAYEALLFEYDRLPCPSRLGRDALDRTITVQSFSKSYCLTGLRIGYAVAQAEIIAAMADFQGHLCGNVSTPVQYAALEALDTPEFPAKLVRIFQKRRDLAYRLFGSLFPVEKPGGAFYLFADIRAFMDRFKDDREFCAYVLERAGVALLPGSAFGVEGYARIAYTADETLIERAYQRVKDVL